MRSDYGLYAVAVICFVLAAVFATNMVSGYELSTASGITVTVVFFVIGVIAAAVGYSARPKAMMRPQEPVPAPITTAPITTAPIVEPTPITEEPEEPLTPPVPVPIVESSMSSESVTHETTEPPEPPPHVMEVPAEPEMAQTPMEAPAEVAAEEKPKTKPTRRRRKKATA